MVLNEDVVSMMMKGTLHSALDRTNSTTDSNQMSPLSPQLSPIPRRIRQEMYNFEGSVDSDADADDDDDEEEGHEEQDEEKSEFDDFHDMDMSELDAMLDAANEEDHTPNASHYGDIIDDFEEGEQELHVENEAAMSLNFMNDVVDDNDVVINAEDDDYDDWHEERRKYSDLEDTMAVNASDA
eukprot:m.78194 g.78194  ORF g.78194 m.78194 type:complete len:183 (+) comp8566_c1_seq1:156-704(+)